MSLYIYYVHVCAPVFSLRFALEKLAEVFTSAGFEVVENHYVQRMTVNHKEAISAERIFIQGRFARPRDSEIVSVHQK